MNVESIICNPSENYHSPHQIIEDDSLELDQKILALESWKQQCIHLQEGSGEGMNDGAGRELQAVSKALIEAREIKREN